MTSPAQLHSHDGQGGMNHHNVYKGKEGLALPARRLAPARSPGENSFTLRLVRGLWHACQQ